MTYGIPDANQLMVAALVARLGGRVEITDAELATANRAAIEVWQDRVTRRTSIIVYTPETGPLMDLGETPTAADIDLPAAIEPPPDRRNMDTGEHVIPHRGCILR